MAQVKKSWLNHTRAGSYSGVNAFVRSQKHWLSRLDAETELRKINSYSLHKSVRRKFKRRHVKINFYNEIWSADLKDISNIAEYNNCNNFILVVVDAFSKQAFCRLIKNKTSASMIKAFKSILKESKGEKPIYLWTDSGKEFLSTAFKAYLKGEGIIGYQTHSKVKATMAEVFIKTLFTRLSRYMTERNTLKIDDVLQGFTNSYNNTYHTKIKRKPSEVNKENQMQIWSEIYKKDSDSKPKRPSLLKVGDIVRISVEKLRFEKGEATYLIIFTRFYANNTFPSFI